MPDEQQKRMFVPEEKQLKIEPDEFAQNCRPLEELLDSVRHIEGFPLGKDEDILALSCLLYTSRCV